MKPKYTRIAGQCFPGKLTLSLLGAALVAAAPSAFAAPQTWDDANVSNSWNLATLNWDAGAAAWSNGSDAIFGGTGEAVDSDAALTANNLTFNSGGYSIVDTGTAGSLTLVGAPSLLAVTNSSDSATISEILAGSGGISKTGAGTLRLNGANSFSGPANVSAGVLQLGNASAMGVGGNNVAFQTGNLSSVSSGATLQLITGIAPNNEHLTLVGDGAAGAATPAGYTTLGALYAVPNAASSNTRWGLSSFNGSGVSGNSTAAFPAITLAGSTTIRVDGTIASSKVLLGYIAGSGMTLNKTGTGGIGLDRGANIGTFNLLEGSVAPNAANSFAWGAVNISAGALWENQQNLTFNSASIALTVNGTYDLNSRTAGGDAFTQNIGTLNGSGTISNGTVGTSVATGAQTLNINSATADSVFDGVITRNAGGTVNIAKGGAGTKLTLNGNNNYPGSTTINAGTLQIGSGGATGTLGLGPVSVAAGSSLIINRSGSISVAGSVGGSGSLIKEGTGSAILAAASNSFGGDVAVNGGKLYIRGSAAGSVTLAPGTSFGASGDVFGALTVPAGASAATRGTLDLADGAIGNLTLFDTAGLTLGGAAGDSSDLIAEVSGSTADVINLGINQLIVGDGGLNITIASLGATGGQLLNLLTFDPSSGITTGTGTTVGNITLANPSIAFGVTGTLVVTADAVQLQTFGAPSPASAYWSGAKGANWTDTGSGQGNFMTTATGSTFIATLPGSTTDVYFANSSAGNLATTLGQAFEIRSLTFLGATTGASSIGGSQQLTLLGDGSGNGITLQPGNGGATLSMSTLLLGNDQTWTNNSSNPLNVSAAVNGNDKNLTITGGSTNLGGGSFTPLSLVLNSNTDLKGTSISTDFLDSSGNITNSGPGNVVLTATGFSTGTLSGEISDGGAGMAVSIVKNGFETLTLAGSNSHTGLTTINGGVVKIANASALGSVTANTVVLNNATLDLNGQSTDETITVIGTGSLSQGALINSDVVNAASVNVNIPSSTSFTVGGDGDVNLQRVGAGNTGIFILTKVGAGTVTTAGAGHNNLMALDVSTGTFVAANTGGFTVDRGARVTGGGTLRLSGVNEDLIGNGSDMGVFNGTLDLNGKSETVGRIVIGDTGSTGTLIGGGTLTVGPTYGNFGTNTPAGAGIIDARNGSADVVLAGTGIPLVKTTSGTVELTQPGIYSGNTIVSEGTLKLNFASLEDAADVEITTTNGAGAFLELAHGETDTIRSLVVNGETLDAGLYGGEGSAADIKVPYLTGTGMLDVTAGGGYTAWAKANGIEGEPATGDFDKDGIINLVEYALAGLNPTQSDPSPGSLVGNLLTFTKRAEAVANGDVTYSILESSTLGEAPEPWATAAPITEDDLTISWMLPSGSPKEFARLIVVLE